MCESRPSEGFRQYFCEQEGYTLETVLSVSPTGGVNRAMMDWGDVLLAKYGKERYAYRRDLAVRQLGYSTDNGGKRSNGHSRFAKSSLVAHLSVLVDP